MLYDRSGRTDWEEEMQHAIYVSYHESVAILAQAFCLLPFTLNSAWLPRTFFLFTVLPCNSARSRPPCGGMAALSDELSAILLSNNVCASFAEWLKENGLTDVEDLAVLAMDEDSVQKEDLGPLQRQGAISF